MQHLNLYRRPLITCSAILAACCVASGSHVLGQVTFDKPQLEQLEVLERQLLYYPHLYGADHLERFQRRGGSGSTTRRCKAVRRPGSFRSRKGNARTTVGILRGQWIAGARLEPVARQAGFNTDAFLFVDYPGYGGLCSGKPCPKASASARGIGPGGGETSEHRSGGVAGQGLCVWPFAGLRCGPAGGRRASSSLRRTVRPFTSTADVAQARFGIPKKSFQHCSTIAPACKSWRRTTVGRG